MVATILLAVILTVLLVVYSCIRVASQISRIEETEYDESDDAN